jgi:hypothetical protein
VNENEQHETDEPDDLEPSAEDAEQVVGGAVTMHDIPVVKTTDKSSP